MVLLLRDVAMATSVTTPSSPLKMKYFPLQNTDFPSYPRYLYINPYLSSPPPPDAPAPAVPTTSPISDPAPAPSKPTSLAPSPLLSPHSTPLAENPTITKLSPPLTMPTHLPQNDSLLIKSAPLLIAVDQQKKHSAADDASVVSEICSTHFSTAPRQSPPLPLNRDTHHQSSISELESLFSPSKRSAYTYVPCPPTPAPPWCLPIRGIGPNHRLFYERAMFTWSEEPPGAEKPSGNFHLDWNFSSRYRNKMWIQKRLNCSLSLSLLCGNKHFCLAAPRLKFRISESYIGMGFGYFLAQMCVIGECLVMGPGSLCLEHIPPLKSLVSGLVKIDIRLEHNYRRLDFGDRVLQPCASFLWIEEICGHIFFYVNVAPLDCCEKPIRSMLFRLISDDKYLYYAEILVKIHGSVWTLCIGFGICWALLCRIGDWLLKVPYFCCIFLDLILYLIFIYWWCSWTINVESRDLQCAKIFLHPMACFHHRISLQLFMQFVPSWLPLHRISDQQFFGTFDCIGIPCYLFVEHKFWTGSIQEMFILGENLTQLELWHNQFVGSIPDYIFELLLMSFVLDLNNFTGHIPVSLWSAATSMEFSAANKQLEGSFPAKIGNDALLQGIVPSNHRITGRIPAVELGYCTLLATLDLGNNGLDVFILEQLNFLPKSYVVDLCGNLYVAWKIAKSGVTTIAGGYSQKAGNANGPASDATFPKEFELVLIPETCALMVFDHGNRVICQITLKAEYCNRKSSYVLETTSAWLLGMGFPPLISLVVGFEVRPYVLPYKGVEPHQSTWTGIRGHMNLERQAAMLCSGMRSIAVKSTVYTCSQQTIPLTLSHLFLMFRLESSSTKNDSLRLLMDLDLLCDVNSSSSNSGSGIISRVVASEEVKDLTAFDEMRTTNGNDMVGQGEESGSRVSWYEKEGKLIHFIQHLEDKVFLKAWGIDTTLKTPAQHQPQPNPREMVTPAHLQQGSDPLATRNRKAQEKS